jgi:hypothetical protein
MGQTKMSQMAEKAKKYFRAGFATLSIARTIEVE